MSSTAQIPVHESKYRWNTTINAVPYSIDIRVFDSIDSQGSSVRPTLNLNGIGEGRYSAAIAPTILGPNVLSPILPFQGELELTPANIERIASEVPEAIATEGLRRINDAKRITHTSLNMIARSQGGAPGIRAAYENPELFDNLAFVMPFGLNRSQLGSTEAGRRATIIKRLAIAGVRANPFEYGNFRSTLEMGSYMVKSAVKGTLLPSLDAALTFDLGEEISQLAEHKRVAVFVGNRDPLFPGREIRDTLQDSKVSIIEVDGTHATPGSRSGQRQMKIAGEWLLDSYQSRG